MAARDLGECGHISKKADVAAMRKGLSYYDASRAADIVISTLRTIDILERRLLRLTEHLGIHTGGALELNRERRLQK